MAWVGRVVVGLALSFLLLEWAEGWIVVDPEATSLNPDQVAARFQSYTRPIERNGSFPATNTVNDGSYLFTSC